MSSIRFPVVATTLMMGLAAATSSAVEAQTDRFDSFAVEFLSVLQSGDPAQLAELLPTADELEWFVSNGTTETDRSVLLADVPSRRAEIVEEQGLLLAETLEYNAENYPVLPLGGLEYVSYSLNSDDGPDPDNFITQYLTLTLSSPFQGQAHLLWTVEVGVLETASRVALGGPDWDWVLLEGPSPAVDAFVEAVVHAVTGQEEAAFEDLVPSLEDLRWALDNRLTAEATEMMREEGGEDLGLNAGSLPDWLDASAYDQAGELLLMFAEAKGDAQVEAVRVTSYEILPEDPDILVTHWLDVEFEVDFVDRQGVAYGMQVGAVQGVEKLFLGAFGGDLWGN